MRFSLLLILFCTLTTSALSWDAPKNPAAKQSLKVAEQYMDDGVFHYAVDELNKAISKERHPDIYVLLGRCYRSLEKRKLAYFAYKNALSLENDNNEALVSLGDLALEFGTIKELKELLPALQSLDKSLAALVQHGLYCRQGNEALKKLRFRTAYRFFDKALQVNGESVEAEAGAISALSGLAKVYRQTKKYSKELKVLIRLYHMVPTKQLGQRIHNVFKIAGANATSRQSEVKSIVEHAQTLPDK